ncbi:translation initiation factor eIF-2B subunit alpha [Pseudoscourfieldia marina]
MQRTLSAIVDLDHPLSPSLETAILTKASGIDDHGTDVGGLQGAHLAQAAMYTDMMPPVSGFQGPVMGFQQAGPFHQDVLHMGGMHAATHAGGTHGGVYGAGTHTHTGAHLGGAFPHAGIAPIQGMMMGGHPEQQFTGGTMRPNTTTIAAALGGASGGSTDPNHDPQREARKERMLSEFYTALQALGGDANLAVAAVRALTNAITRSNASTFMELVHELTEGAAFLREAEGRGPQGIGLTSGCELFLRHLTRSPESISFGDLGANDDHMKALKSHLSARGEQFTEVATAARARIAKRGATFIREGAVVLVHGFSRVVLAVMEHARRSGKSFRVVATEARPDNAGYRMAEALRTRGVDAAVALDSSVCRVLETCDCAFVGAEGVCASGGVLNRIGTRQIALLCQAAGRPLYCAAESFKLTRAFPLGGGDAPQTTPGTEESTAVGVEMGAVAPVAGSEESLLAVATRARDYTEPKTITLVITDLGAWAPSAVSEELLMLYA